MRKRCGPHSLEDSDSLHESRRLHFLSFLLPDGLPRPPDALRLRHRVSRERLREVLHLSLGRRPEGLDLRGLELRDRSLDVSCLFPLEVLSGRPEALGLRDLDLRDVHFSLETFRRREPRDRDLRDPCSSRDALLERQALAESSLRVPVRADPEWPPETWAPPLPNRRVMPEVVPRRSFAEDAREPPREARGAPRVRVPNSPPRPSALPVSNAAFVALAFIAAKKALAPRPV